jgi:signal transduction histidine kinase
MATNNKRLRCFLAIPYSLEFAEVRKAIEKGARDSRSDVASLDSVVRAGTVQEALFGELARADCIIAEVSNSNPNVFFELGLAQAMGKALFLLARSKDISRVPFDIRSNQFLVYDSTPDGYSTLSKELATALKNHRKAPRAGSPYPGTRFVAPFFIDWNRLSTEDIDNLIRELLSQLGYRRVNWSTKEDFIDLVAELPKKDPDGFEYRELWLIAMGQRSRQKALWNELRFEAEYTIDRMVRNNTHNLSINSGEALPTLLIILREREERIEDFEQYRILTQRRERPSNFRVRVWDLNYLTTLVQQFPLIGYKYFSPEARIKSESRKTYEELYEESITLFQETVRLNKHLATTVDALEDEKNRRVRAERDAVWKDISFTAAHKIGNPIFAIETFLEPLKKRISESRAKEALNVIQSIEASVERAKIIVDQFKSLKKAQEICPEQIRLRPLLDEVAQVFENKKVKFTIECPENLKITADPIRLAECFDELARNSLHWFDKSNKIVEVKVTQPASEPLPTEIDSTNEYTLIEFRDNGKGINAEDKREIFNAFFTRRDQGTGLGLAIVRRIIEGHHGFILERGVPGRGATFEMYLPIKSEKTIST